MKHLFLSLALLVAIAHGAAANESAKPEHVAWSFDGVFGTVDKQSAQRGFKVYKEVCSACHSLHRLYYRNLEGLGFSEGEIKVLASQATVKDGPNDAGEMFDRPGRPSDHFVGPYANDNAAAAANNGAMPPDLSLIIKARHDGANYLHALLNGYGKQPPKEIQVPEGKYYNPYYPGGVISMPPPLTSEGQVTYDDGTKSTVEQMSRDVVNFLQYAAEPEMEARKRMGIKVMLYLAIAAVFLYIAKRRVWRDVH